MYSQEYSQKKLDGITGDVVGMTIECSQVIFLLSTYLLNQFIMV